jgi:hypothetical protein
MKLKLEIDLNTDEPTLLAFVAAEMLRGIADKIAETEPDDPSTTYEIVDRDNEVFCTFRFVKENP